jgi:hypothetical protein
LFRAHTDGTFEIDEMNVSLLPEDDA